MSAPIIRKVRGTLMALGLALGLATPLLGQAPNDRIGVGSAGKIGRGTSAGERFYPATPVSPPPVAYYYPVPVTVPSLPVPTGIERSHPVDRSATPPDEGANKRLALVRSNPYMAYHRGWVNGYWSIPHPAAREGLEPGQGMGLGWGIPSWLIGPMVYDWGYLPYENPYFLGERRESAAGAESAAVSVYSQPIYSRSVPPTEAVLNDAIASFHAACTAFQREDYRKALNLTGQALRLMPGDPTLHEFRALTLFALHRYDEAAETLHSVLAVGPGWDWITLTNFYTKLESYTRQLRTLESYCDQNAPSAAAHFVRAYHYLTTGYVAEALAQWKEVTALQAKDRLAAELIRELQPPGPGLRTPMARTSAGGSGQPGKLEGTWTAHPRDDTAIALTFHHRGHVVWKVSQQGRERRYEGYGIYVNNTLTLTPDEDNALVGGVHWKDTDHFTFRILERRPDDPGLSFVKTPQPHSAHRDPTLDSKHSGRSFLARRP